MRIRIGVRGKSPPVPCPGSGRTLIPSDAIGPLPTSFALYGTFPRNVESAENASRPIDHVAYRYAQASLDRFLSRARERPEEMVALDALLSGDPRWDRGALDGMSAHERALYVGAAKMIELDFTIRCGFCLERIRVERVTRRKTWIVLRAHEWVERLSRGRIVQ